MVVTGTPEEILELLTAPEVVARWPVPFELAEGRLVAGGQRRVDGRLAGRAVEFGVQVLQADERRLAPGDGSWRAWRSYLLKRTRPGSPQ
jgi:uncharacterized protein YndB with AHSA1/START domain